MQKSPGLVAALVYDGLCTFEFGIAVEIFGLPRPEFDFPWYRFAAAGVDGRRARAIGGVTIEADAGLEILADADTIIVPGWRGPDEAPPEALLAAIRYAVRRGARRMAEPVGRATMPPIKYLTAMGVALVLAAGIAFAHEAKQPAATAKTMTPGMEMGRLIMPTMDPVNGKKLFVDKGCVACHAINGVGGHDAPAMDAHEMEQKMNPFEFAAKMWNHAPGMIAAQEDALGEMITFTGAELADIIAFVHHDATQHGFSERNLTPEARKMMQHEHGGMTAPKSHGEEIGHRHAK